MNFNTVIAMAVNAFSQRGVNVDLNTPLGTFVDLTGTVGAQLVNLAHLELQREHDFDAMDLPLTTQLYTTGGFALPATVKRVYALYYQQTGASNQAIRGCPIWPANKEDVIRIGLTHHRHHGTTGPNSGCWEGFGDWRGYRFPGGSSALDMNPGGTVWWMKGGKVVLGSAAGNGDDSPFNGKTLWLDTYSYLPDYALMADSDWFTVWGADVLILKACILAAGVGQRDERLEYFEMVLNGRPDMNKPGKLAQLLALDERASVGGQADLVIAPTYGYSMRR
jgi:hypothetical protein